MWARTSALSHWVVSLCTPCLLFQLSFAAHAFGSMRLCCMRATLWRRRCDTPQAMSCVDRSPVRACTCAARFHAVSEAAVLEPRNFPALRHWSLSSALCACVSVAIGGCCPHLRSAVLCVVCIICHRECLCALTHARGPVCMCLRMFFCRVQDYWFGYKMFCYAFYSHSVEHESEFRDSKLGWWPSAFWHLARLFCFIG